MKRNQAAALALALAAVMTATPATLGAEEASFADVAPGDWFAPYVETCVREGLLNGVGDGKFAPDGPVNEDEAIVMAARVLWHADGGEGPLPQGPSPEEMVQRTGGANEWFPNGVDTARWMSELWSWDGFCYLALRAQEEGFAPPLSFTTYAADRAGFFRTLAFAAQGLDLPAVNEVEQVPGTRDESVLRLYRAGILSGTDGYGTFAGQRSLTRAEAAAALARLAQPDLRTHFQLESVSWPYTLTYLTDGWADCGVDYPVVPLSGRGILTLDGEILDWPGHVYSFGLSDDGDFCHFDVVVEEPYEQRTFLMDAQGEYVSASGQYRTLHQTNDGHLLAADSWSDGEVSHTRWLLLDRAGTVLRELPETLGGSSNNWWGYSEGVCPWLDEESGLWGYVDATGKWLVEPVWANASDFRRGYAVVENELGLWGCIDLKGNTVLPFQYSFLNLPRDSWDYEGPVVFTFQDTEGRMGLVDPDGAAVYIPVYEQPELRVSSFRNGYGLCRSDNATGSELWYINAAGQAVSERFDWASDINTDGAGFVGLDGKIYRIQFE